MCPASPTLRTILAMEFKRLYRKGGRVLEIGCGEGDSAEPVLRYTNAAMDLLDESPEMVRLAKKRLQKFQKRVKFIREDGLNYLLKSAPYDLILSSWTIHNFKWKEKVALFQTIHRKLKPGGAFILMDKVYPEHDKKELLNLQLRRYQYLSRQGCSEIIAHEKIDFKKPYRMDENQLMSTLKKIGFRVRIADRVERDAVIVATK